jgi:predicted transcriptional regulator
MLPRQLKALLQEANVPEQDCTTTLAMRASSQVNTYIRVINVKLDDSRFDSHSQDSTVNSLLQRLHQLEKMAQADPYC